MNDREAHNLIKEYRTMLEDARRFEQIDDCAPSGNIAARHRADQIRSAMKYVRKKFANAGRAGDLILYLSDSERAEL